MKKLISISLILCILFSCSSFTVFAQEEQGEIIEFCNTIKFDTSTNTLYYSGDEEFRTFTYAGDFYDADYIKRRETLFQKATKLVIEEGAVEIPREYFHDMKNLEEVVLPSSLKSIEDFSFWNCPKLKSVSGENVTEICAGAFGECTALTYADFPEVQHLGKIRCGTNNNGLGIYRYQKLSIKEPDIYEEEYIIRHPVHEYYVGAFQGCSSLKEVSIPNIKGIGAKTFYKCNSLTTINKNNHLDNVTYLGRTAFYGCKSLRNISLERTKKLISGHDPIADTKDEGVFGYCTSLESVNIPNAEYMGNGTFYGCTKLKKINTNNTLSKVTTLGEYSFAGCKSLENISLPKVKSLNYGKWSDFDEEELNKIRSTRPGSTFWDSFDSWEYEIIYNNIKKTVITRYCAVFANCTKLKSVKLGDVENIRKKTFANCQNLTTVTTGKSLKSVGDYAFYKCSSLKSVTLPKNVASLGIRAFARCTKLKTVNVKSTSLKKVGLDAFKIINKTPTFNCPKSKLKTCKKLIKPNAPSKAKFVGKF